MFALFEFGAKQIFGGPTLILGGGGEGEKLLGELFPGGSRGGFGWVEQVCFARFFDELFGMHQRGQMFWNSIERAPAFAFGAGFFGFFNFLPLRPNFIDGFGVAFAKHVWMAANEFFGNVSGNVIEIKRAALAGELAVKDDLKEKVPKFFEHFVIVGGFDGIDEFVNLFDGVKTQRHVILLAVPGAAGGRAEAGHNFDEFIDGGFGGFCLVRSGLGWTRFRICGAPCFGRFH